MRGGCWVDGVGEALLLKVVAAVSWKGIAVGKFALIFDSMMRAQIEAARLVGNGPTRAVNPWEGYPFSLHHIRPAFTQTLVSSS